MGLKTFEIIPFVFIFNQDREASVQYSCLSEKKGLRFLEDPSQFFPAALRVAYFLAKTHRF